MGQKVSNLVFVCRSGTGVHAGFAGKKTCEMAERMILRSVNWLKKFASP